MSTPTQAPAQAHTQQQVSPDKAAALGQLMALLQAATAQAAALGIELPGGVVPVISAGESAVTALQGGESSSTTLGVPVTPSASAPQRAPLPQGQIQLRQSHPQKRGHATVPELMPPTPQSRVATTLLTAASIRSVVTATDAAQAGATCVLSPGMEVIVAPTLLLASLARALTAEDTTTARISAIKREINAFAEKAAPDTSDNAVAALVAQAGAVEREGARAVALAGALRRVAAAQTLAHHAGQRARDAGAAAVAGAAAAVAALGAGELDAYAVWAHASASASMRNVSNNISAAKRDVYGMAVHDANNSEQQQQQEHGPGPLARALGAATSLAPDGIAALQSLAQAAHTTGASAVGGAVSAATVAATVVAVHCGGGLSGGHTHWDVLVLRVRTPASESAALTSAAASAGTKRGHSAARGGRGHSSGGGAAQPKWTLIAVPLPHPLLHEQSKLQSSDVTMVTRAVRAASIGVCCFRQTAKIPTASFQAGVATESDMLHALSQLKPGAVVTVTSALPHRIGELPPQRRAIVTTPPQPPAPVADGLDAAAALARWAVDATAQVVLLGDGSGAAIDWVRY